MNSRLFYVPCFIGIFLSCCLQAQLISSRVVDAATGEGIPYATVEFGTGLGVITNEEGRFSFNDDKEGNWADSLHVSCIGYEKTAFSFMDGLDTLISLQPKAIELRGVYLFDHELTADEIIDKVMANLCNNYKSDPISQRLFLRHSSYNTLTKMDIDFKESTIEELNEKFIDSVIRVIPKSASNFTETLGDYYRQQGDERLLIVKAATLSDKNNEGSMEALSAKLEKIFKENVKPNSYLKIKSGIFGGKVQVDSVLNESEQTPEIKEADKLKGDQNFLDNRKGELNKLFSDQFFSSDSKLNFLEKRKRYEFKIEGYTTMDDGGVFVLSFVPKSGQDFKGTLYINMEDFAVLRLEYVNVKPLRSIRLLGLSYKETVFRGTAIYTKIPGNTYAVKFIEKVEGRVMGVDRPLKVIEKNKFVKGPRKQNELSLGIDIINQNTEKTELVVFEATPVTGSEFEQVKENDSVRSTHMSRYDPEFWKGYNVMEPNQAIREFTVLPEEGGK